MSRKRRPRSSVPSFTWLLFGCMLTLAALHTQAKSAGPTPWRAADDEDLASAWAARSVSLSSAAPSASADASLIRSFAASADATVTLSAPDVNFGDSTFMEIGDEISLSPTVQTEAWLTFDLSSVPVTATVEYATLEVAVHPGGFGANVYVAALPASDDWDEHTLTWNSRPALATAVDSQYYSSGTTALTWDLTSAAAEWVADSGSNSGLALQSLGADGDWLRFFYSRESDFPPQMVVTYTLPGDAFIFSGAVQEVGFGPPEDHSMAEIPVRLHVSTAFGEIGDVVDQTVTDAQGEYALHFVGGGELMAISYTLVMSDSNYLVVNAFPEDKETPEGYIQYDSDTLVGHHSGNVFHVEPATWPISVTRLFTGTVLSAGGTEPAPQVEVVLYSANDDPAEPLQVLAGASTAADGTFRLVYNLESSDPVTYVLQIADYDHVVMSATPGPGGEVTEDHRIFFANPDHGTYAENVFVVEQGAGGGGGIGASQAMERRPVVAVLLTPQCTCGTADCTTITNANVLSAFGDTLFKSTGDSVHNFFVENSQSAFGLSQAGLFQVVPMDDPSTAGANESTNCPIAGRTSEQHRAYVTRLVLGQQLSFNFANFDADNDNVVEKDELIVLLAATDSHTGNARTRNSDPSRVRVGTVDVEVNYIMVQPGTDFSTIAHEVAHSLPFPQRTGAPGDLYGGTGNAGTYSLMDNHCHGRINILDPNTPYTPTQHIHSRRPHLDPWNKIALGWITPTVVTGSSWASIGMVETNGTVYRLQAPSGHPNEYFLVENRWAPDSLYETDLPDSGLAIWHINEDYLPDQRRAIALERAGGGANSGAATAFCNDDADNTALWDGTENFHGSSAPSSDWYGGTNSGIAALCVGPPGTTVQAYLSGNWQQTVLAEDAEEPNPTSSTASSITPGVYDRTLHAPCDTDAYNLTHWKQVVVTVTVSAFTDTGHTQPAPAPQVRITDDSYYYSPSFQGTGTVTAELQFPGVATIEVFGSNQPVYYRMTVASSQATIPPDRFDDQQPPGEVRNDSFAASAAITQAIAANVTLIPGLTIYDLNLEAAADQDFFTLQLPPATDPSTGQSECLPPGDPRLGNPDVWQGSFSVHVRPYFKRPFTIRLYRSDGVEVTSQVTTGTLQASVECPHATGLFTNGQVILHVDDPSGQVNFYQVDVTYHRWYQYIEFPEWLLLTDPPMFRPIPTRWDPILWIYPATRWVQDELLGGGAPPPLPTEFLPFYWDSHLPLTMDVLVWQDRPLDVRLYDAEQNVVAALEPPVGGLAAQEIAAGRRLHAPAMAPGWYALGVDGAEGFTEFSLQFHKWQVYVPLVLRDF